MTNIVEIKVPNIGGGSDVTVAEIYVKAGDAIKLDDNLVMLETDKATMEVPSTHAGIINSVAVKVGDKVNEGSLIVTLNQDVAVDLDESSPKKPQAEPEALPTADNTQPNTVNISTVNVETTSNSQTKIQPILGDSSNNPQYSASASSIAAIKFNEVGFAKAFASPSIRKLARELGADLGKIDGNGRKGRITEEDIKSYVKGVLTGILPSQVGGGMAGGNGLNLLPWPQVDFASFGEVESKPLSRIKKISGANLARNWAMIPHVTQFDEADITDLENFRKQLNAEYKKQDIKLTPLAFIVKSCIFSLKKFPEFNASLDGDNLIYKKYYNIGFAADTPNGLVVPVLKHADKMGLVEIAMESSNLAKLARDGKLKPTDMQGGTFTISSLGGIGGTGFTPIVNAPEVAILGISKSAIKPQWNGHEFAPKLILPLSLSYDHRIIDGALAARFTSFLATALSDIRRLVL